WKGVEMGSPNRGEWVNPNESAVAELPDGTVVLNARSESKANRRLVSVSKDGAGGWSPPRFDDALVEPICMGSLLSVPGEKPVLLFSNPDNLEKTGGKADPGTNRDRKNVTGRLSEDSGKTWIEKRGVEPGFSGYSDLALTKDGTVLLFYERGSTDGATIYKTGRLTVARFPLDWVKGN